MRIQIYIIIYLLSLALVQISQADELYLDNCIKQALENNYTLKLAGYNVEQIKEKKTIAISTYLPQLDFNSSTSYNTSNNYSLGLSLRQNIYDSGKTFAQIDIASEKLNSAEYNLELTRQNLIFNVKRSFYLCLQAQEEIKIYEEEVSAMQEHFKKAKVLYEIGLKSKFDVTKAELELLNTQLALIKAKNNFKITKITLSNIISNIQIDKYELKDELKIELTPEKVNLEEIKSFALKNRPEMLDAQTKIRESEATLSLALSKYFPSLYATSGYNWKGQGFPLTNDWNVGLTLSLILFNGFSTPAEVTTANIQKETALANEELNRQNILLEIEQVYANLIESSETATITEKLIEQSKENLELAKTRYEAGLGSILELIDAEVSYAQAKLNRIKTFCGYKISIAQFKKATGETERKEK
ncbi:MAG: TolC family protein [Candidatus Firestonebacteria bacterium]